MYIYIIYIYSEREREREREREIERDIRVGTRLTPLLVTIAPLFVIALLLHN